MNSNPTNITGANKEAKIYVGRSTPCTIFCAHSLCVSYVTNMFVLVSFSIWRKQLLCFVQGQGQKSEQKHTTKSFNEFHNDSPLLTMFRPVHIRCYKITDRHEILHALSLVDRCL